MHRQTKRTLRASIPNFLPLGSVLIAAEKSTPSRAPRPGLDPDEALAVQLIDNIRHPKPASLPALPRPLAAGAILEMAGKGV